MKKNFLKTTALLLTLVIFSTSTVFAAPPPRGNHPPMKIENRHHNFDHRVSHHTHGGPMVNVRVQHNIPPAPPRHESSGKGVAVALGVLAIGAGIAAIAAH